MVGMVEKSNGSCPVEEILERLTDAEKRSFAYVVRRIADGPPLPKSKYKKLKPYDLWQIRVEDYRFFVLHRRHKNKPLALLTHGAVKKVARLDIQTHHRRAVRLAKEDSW